LSLSSDQQAQQAGIDNIGQSEKQEDVLEGHQKQMMQRVTLQESGLELQRQQPAARGRTSAPLQHRTATQADGFRRQARQRAIDVFVAGYAAKGVALYASHNTPAMAHASWTAQCGIQAPCGCKLCQSNMLCRGRPCLPHNIRHNGRHTTMHTTLQCTPTTHHKALVTGNRCQSAQCMSSAALPLRQCCQHGQQPLQADQVQGSQPLAGAAPGAPWERRLAQQASQILKQVAASAPVPA
jgi:hypothetical protein